MNRFIARQTCLLFILILCVLFIAGCGGGGEGTGETGHWLPGNPDITAPRVTAVVPLNKATGVAINTKKITATFSEAMDSATLTIDSFKLACPAGTPITGGGAVTYVAASRVATLPLPAAPTNLPKSTECTATVTTGAKDLAGNPLASNFVWTFTTGATEDNTAPTVTLTVPVAAVTGVARNTKITATFNEDMDPLTIDGTTFTVVNTTLGGTAVAGDVTYAVAGKTATFTPTTPATLPADTKFTATITAGAKDLAGNALVVPAVSDLPKPNPWTFTTGTSTDSTAPTVTLTVPADTATEVAITASVTATFSEDMNSLSLTEGDTFKLTTTAAPGTLVAGLVTYVALTRIATFNPTADLATSTEYTATVTTAAQDLAGNALAAGAKPNPWKFTTAAAALAAASCAGPGPLDLGTAANYGVLAGTSLTLTNPTSVTGDVGSPSITPAVGPSTLVGTMRDAGTDPSPGVIQTAVTNMQTAVDCANARTCDFNYAAAKDFGGAVLSPGVHCVTGAMSVGSHLTLSTAGVYVFRSTGALTSAPTITVALGGTANATNTSIFWVPTGTASIGATNTFLGTIMDKSAAITLGANTTLNGGRTLSGAAVTLDTNTIATPTY
jgi:hypothetical protein